MGFHKFKQTWIGDESHENKKDKTFPKMKSIQTVQKTKWYPKSEKKLIRLFRVC
jgi:hypothetical protein